MAYIAAKVSGINVRVEISEQGSCPTEYAAQVSCPVDECYCSYNSEYKLDPSKAKSDVMRDLKRHYEKNHK